ncbi:compound eye opsin BCRH2-like [Corticium candelabrum]|uniref:compound eye opsin BCRH2-like n=1 Tax=Corticium candelabrum TaxID=121492 RepID=UPI002E254ADA|nr:compound eye opsin BCRH2-like [Corticium candelabrum]
MKNESLVLINSTSLNTTLKETVDASFILYRIPAGIQFVLCGLALYAFYRLPNVRKVINYPIIGLVASDILRAVLTLLSMPFRFMQYGNPSIGEQIYCEFFRYANNVQLSWSSWTLVIITYSRYDAVANVFDPKFNKRRFWTLTVTSWIVSALTSLPPIMGWSSYNLRRMNDMYICTTGSNGKDLASATFLPFFYFVNYVVPSILVFILLSCIARIAVKMEKKRQTSSSNTSKWIVVLPGFSHPSSSSSKQNKQESTGHIKKIIRSRSFLYIVLIVVTNVFFLAPYVGMTSYDTVSRGLGLRTKISRAVIQITTILFMVNYNVNCLLYIFWIKSVQQAIAASCCRRKKPAAAARVIYRNNV